jgi:acyl carrier protein
MTSLRERVQQIFRDTFEDDSLILEDSMTAHDVDGWDSLAHINLIIAVESELGIRFATAEISGLKDPSQNVGTFLKLIEEKLRGIAVQ